VETPFYGAATFAMKKIFYFKNQILSPAVWDDPNVAPDAESRKDEEIRGK